MTEVVASIGLWLLCIAVIVFEKWSCEPISLQWRWQVTKPSKRFLLLATVVFRGASLAGIGVIFVCDHYRLTPPFLSGRAVWLVLSVVELLVLCCVLVGHVSPKLIPGRWLAFWSHWTDGKYAGHYLVAVTAVMFLVAHCPSLWTILCVGKYFLVLCGAVDDTVSPLDITGLSMGVIWTAFWVWGTIVFLRNPFYGL